jgi:hypothetical protein
MALLEADQSRYAKLQDDMSNDTTKGVYNFPKMIIKTMCCMTDYKVPPRAQCIRAGVSEGVAFVQAGGAAAGETKAATTTNIKCWHCGKMGHYKTYCPELKVDDAAEEGAQNLSIKEWDEGHGLLMAKDDEECALVQDLFGNGGKVHGIISPDHAHIDIMRATYASTPYAHVIENKVYEATPIRGLW